MDELPPWRGPKVQGSNKNLFKLWVSIGHSTVILPLFEFFFSGIKSVRPARDTASDKTQSGKKKPFIS